jgi:hypothetical protein
MNNDQYEHSRTATKWIPTLRQREIERLRREAAALLLEADMLEAETEVLLSTGQLPEGS